MEECLWRQFAALLKLILLNGCFSRFLHCIHYTKLGKASQFFNLATLLTSCLNWFRFLFDKKINN